MNRITTKRENPQDALSSYDPARYGDSCAEFYDQLYGPPRAPMLDALAGLAGDGRVLELGIGSGRVALALVRRGLAVSGIEASAAMREHLRAKPGAERIEVIAGDFADMRVEGDFALVMALVSTLFLLPCPTLQARCIAHAAARLATGGHLLIEACVPSAEQVGQPARHEHMISTAVGERCYRVELCPVGPDDLDAMAASAGLRLAARWRDWARQPFAATDPSHISVYARA
jgi:SAM-dependent methyltransferase